MGRWVASVALCGAASLAGCSDESGPNCQHRVCDIREESCIEFVAEVVACQREVPVVLPNVRFATTEELLAEREQPTQAQLDHDRDYWAGEALVGLMPENYEPANVGADSFSGVLAFYTWDTEEITIVSDSNSADEETGYRVLVHEMIHAHQDAEYDLEALWDRHVTSFPRSLGMRAALEGEAVLFTALADIELAGFSEDEADWDTYFRNWQDDMLERARDSEVPSLDVTGLFPYAFGGEQTYRVWDAGGLDAVREHVLDPPHSVRDVMADLHARTSTAADPHNELAPWAVPVLPGHTYLGGAGQDSWLLNTMMQRIAGNDRLWDRTLHEIEADHLSVWRDDETAGRVAVWRLAGDTRDIEYLLTGLGSGGDTQWVATPEDATRYFIRPLGDDWILVATESDSAVAVADSITGWQSQDEAFERAGLDRRPRPRELVLHGSRGGGRSPTRPWGDARPGLRGLPR